MNESLDTFELQLLWDGVEDFTGLWQAEALARHSDGGVPGVSPRGRARRSLERLAISGLIVIYACRGIPTDKACDQVGLEGLSKLLDIDASWRAPDEGEVGIWYDTSEEGFATYREATGWQ